MPDANDDHDRPFDRPLSPKHVARGIRVALGGRRHHCSKGMLKVVIVLDEETFEEVRNRAIAAHGSFAAQARNLIEIGLETMKADGQ